MKKLLGIVVLGLLWCNVGFAITQQEAIDKYFKGKQLETIEGVWFDEHNDDVIYIYKEKDKYICKVIRSENFIEDKKVCELNKGSNERYYGMWNLYNKGLAKNVRLLRVDPVKRKEVNTGDINLMHVKKDGIRRKIMWKLYPDVSGNSAGSPSASGSAFFVTAKGHIVTNYHVVEGCNDKSKIMYNDKEYSAKLLASDKKLDLALLKADLKNKGYLKFSYDPKKMQKIYVAGYPLGKFLSDDLKFTDGIVSSLKGFEDNTNQIQISAAINPGNSGGPVINQSGELVGVAVSGLDKGVTEGINFAIKSEPVKTFLTSNKVKPSTSFYSRELKNDKLLTILENATVYTFCN